jgi:hypothetical protein
MPRTTKLQKANRYSQLATALNKIPLDTPFTKDTILKQFYPNPVQGDHDPRGSFTAHFQKLWKAGYIQFMGKMDWYKRVQEIPATESGI